MIALGSGQESVIRSMATDMVDAGGVSIVYSAITMMRAIGGSISGPIYAGLYAVGLRLGGIWLGLPFIAAGMLFGIAFVLLMLLKERRANGYEEISNREQEEDE